MSEVFLCRSPDTTSPVPHTVIFICDADKTAHTLAPVKPKAGINEILICMNYHDLNDKLNCNFHTFRPVIPFGFLQAFSAGSGILSQVLSKTWWKPEDSASKSGSWRRLWDRRASGDSATETSGRVWLKTEVSFFFFCAFKCRPSFQRGAGKAAWIYLKPC